MLRLSYFDDSVKICVPVSGFEAQSAMTRGFQPICIPWLGRTLTRCSYDDDDDDFEYLLWAQHYSTTHCGECFFFVLLS